MWRRRAAGYAWLAAWMIVLYLVAAPWRGLGGLVDERLRWTEWFVLITALPLGFAVGRFGRERVVSDPTRTHLEFLRWLLYPLGALTALSLLVLTWLGQRGPIGVVTTGFLAYWAGLDLAFGAVPLMEGKSYRLLRPLDPERAPPAVAEPGWVPPWERF